MSSKDIDPEEFSGVSSAKGYEYQKLIAAYYLIAEESREIEYEAHGEDITIVNEDIGYNSLEFIQAKYLSEGSFSLPAYSKKVFPQFWKAFKGTLEKYPDKALLCTLYTSVSWNRDLKIFMDSCKNYRERGITVNELNRAMRVIDRQYQAMKGSKDQREFNRWLWGVRIVHTFPPEHVKEKIIDYMKNCGIPEPRQKLGLVMDYISEVSQGRITRRQVEDIIGSELRTIEVGLEKNRYSEIEIKNALLSLNTARLKYGVDGDFPDKEKCIVDMISPIKRGTSIIKSLLDEKKFLYSSLNDYEDANDIISSDAHKAKEAAEKVGNLETELWLAKKTYAQRINSIIEQASNFDITFE
jgi:hypothetical protein